jgi:cysteine desulfurase
LWDGGGQERGLRSGTENLPGIAGFARAASLGARAAADGACDRLATLRDGFEARVRATLPGVEPTVTGVARAPHISSLRLAGLPAEPLLHALDARGVVASAGSACASKSHGPSHVLEAIGVGDDDAVLRFSLSRETTAEELEHAAAALAAAVAEIGTAPR